MGQIQNMASAERIIKPATLYLDEELIRGMKVISVQEDKPIGEVWNEAAIMYLATKNQAVPPAVETDGQ